MLALAVAKILSIVTTCLSILKRMETRQIEQGEQIAEILGAVKLPEITGVVFDVEIEGILLEGVTTFTMTNSQTATIIAKIEGKGGRPATVEGVLEWKTSDETLATVEALPDRADGAKLAKLTPTGPVTDPAGPGVTVTCSGDADLGAGVQPIFGTLDVPITAGNAIGIKLELGEVTEQ